MKALNINRKILTFFGLCKSDNQNIFFEKIYTVLMNLFIMITFAFNLVVPSIRYILENSHDYYEYNWAIFQAVPVVAMYIAVTSVSIKKTNVKEVMDGFQVIVEQRKLMNADRQKKKLIFVFFFFLFISRKVGIQKRSNFMKMPKKSRKFYRNII